MESLGMTSVGLSAVLLLSGTKNTAGNNNALKIIACARRHWHSQTTL